MLNDLRKKIDIVDAKIATLFVKRMELITAVAKYKKEHNLPTFDLSREQEILGNVSELSPEVFAPYTVDLFKTILDLSKKYQGKKKIDLKKLLQ
jgi:monofunctional chorismate mutase